MTTPELANLLTVRESGCQDSMWGNVFLTQSWTLYVDMFHEQHDAAMQRLGIAGTAILMSGSISRSNGIGFRCTRGVAANELTVEQSQELMAAIRLVCQRLGLIQARSFCETYMDNPEQQANPFARVPAPF